MSKTNEKGRECAAWCEVDHHGARLAPWCHSPRLGTSSAHVVLEQTTYGETPSLEAWVAGRTPDGEHQAAAFVADDALQARWIADALTIAAEMKKADLRALAANVRKAAAEAWPEKEAEAS